MHRYLVLFTLVGYVQPASIIENRVTEDIYQHYDLALDAIFGMGQRLTALLDTSAHKNFVVSPLSTTAVIGQLILGAEGEFRDYLYKLLSLPEEKNNTHNILTINKNNTNQRQPLPYAMFHLQLSGLLKTLRSSKKDMFTLHENNALFYNEDIYLKEDFEDRLETWYETKLTALDFHTDTRSVINKWAAESTNGLIPTIIQDQPPLSTTGIFLNSIYFRAEWQQKFDRDFNQIDKFHVDQNLFVNTTYMQGTFRDVSYAATKDYTIVCLPYLKKELGMYILLPNENSPLKYNIKDFVLNLSAQELFVTMRNLKQRDVTVKIPKLYLNNEINILDPLKKYIELKRIKSESKEKTSKNLFTDIQQEVDLYRRYKLTTGKDIILTGAAKNADLKISQMIQQMVFSITEEGTEAAAVTSVVTDYMYSDNFILNRPFSFLIRHEETSATIFWGTISDPS